MNREIKFRQPVFDKNSKFEEWHYWGIGDREFLGPIDCGKNSYQFTGLKDKNGKEIYEGDIIKEYGELYKVYFDKAVVQFRLEGISKRRNHALDWIYEQAGDYEIIGNVFENPELNQQ